MRVPKACWSTVRPCAFKKECAYTKRKCAGRRNVCGKGRIKERWGTGMGGGREGERERERGLI